MGRLSRPEWSQKVPGPEPVEFVLPVRPLRELEPALLQEPRRLPVMPE